MADNVFRLNTQLLEARTGRVVDSETVEGTGEESIFVLVDDLTKRIKEDFQLSAEEIAADIDEDVGRLTTTSPDALKYYRNGLKSYEIGEYTESISALETAVALDTDFAMAYRVLAVAYTALGYESDARDRLKKAFDRAEKLSPREKFSIQGQFYSRSERNIDLAIEAYNQVLELSPTDFLANRNLGLIYSKLEEWDKAIRHLEINRRNGDQAVQTSIYLAEAYCSSGKMKKAGSILRMYLRRYGERASIHLELAAILLKRGRNDEARRELEAGYTLDPTDYRHALISGDIYLIEGETESSEHEYSKLLDFQEPIAHDAAFRSLSRLFLLQGRIDDAGQIAAELKDLIEKGETGDAVREAEAAVRMLPERGGDDLPRPFYLEQLGRALFAAGRLEHAEDVFKGILSDPYNRLSLGDRYAAAYLWQARIQKKRDNRQKADDFYRSFLSLWVDADSGLPGLEEARSELN